MLTKDHPAPVSASKLNHDSNPTSMWAPTEFLLLKIKSQSTSLDAHDSRVVLKIHIDFISKTLFKN